MSSKTLKTNIVSTAAAMAMSKGWSRLVLPALLAGLYGYIAGTPLGLLVTSLLSR